MSEEQKEYNMKKSQYACQIDVHIDTTMRVNARRALVISEYSS
jgi:hypothetical protein